MSFSQERYVEALRFAAERHQGQTLPASALPYVVHLSMVTMEVIATLGREPFDDPDLAVTCALLHDTIEDTPATHEEVTARFGARVADGVRALTKNADLPKAERMQDSLQRIRAQPREVWIVKLADRITNLQPPPHTWNDAKKTKYRAEAREILDALGEASPYLAGRIAAKIEAYGAFIGTSAPST